MYPPYIPCYCFSHTVQCGVKATPTLLRGEVPLLNIACFIADWIAYICGVGAGGHGEAGGEEGGGRGRGGDCCCGE